MPRTREISKRSKKSEKTTLKPKKSLGQNFLNDPRVVQDIVMCADISRKDAVIEVGPGLGVMTKKLAENAGLVAAVEIDRDLIPGLEEIAKFYGNIAVVQGDILKFDIGRDIIGKIITPAGFESVKVCANLPYYITTPIIMKFLEECGDAVDSMVVMVQKEVAERMTARPGGKDYGAMTVAVQYHTEASIVLNVPPRCFTPAPSVDSAVVKMVFRKERPFELTDESFFFSVVRAAFAQRRKTLANALGNAPYIPATSAEVTEILTSMGLDPLARGETLSGERFAELSNELLKRHPL